MRKFRVYANIWRSEFYSIKKWKKSLEDLAAHFWNGKKDMYYLGMIQSQELQ